MSAAATSLLLAGLLGPTTTPLRRIAATHAHNFTAFAEASSLATLPAQYSRPGDIYDTLFNKNAEFNADDSNYANMFSPQFFIARPGLTHIVYALIAVGQTAFYIGSTERELIGQRFVEHLRAARSGAEPGRRATLYRHMRRVGPHRFAIIPLLRATKGSLRAIEYTLIRNLQPSLNSSHDFMSHISRLKRSFRAGLSRQITLSRRLVAWTPTLDREGDERDADRQSSDHDDGTALVFFRDVRTGKMSNSMGGTLRAALYDNAPPRDLLIAWVAPPSPNLLDLDDGHLWTIYAHNSIVIATSDGETLTTLSDLPQAIRLHQRGVFYLSALHRSFDRLRSTKDTLIQLALNEPKHFLHLSTDTLFELRDSARILEKESSFLATQRKLESLIFRSFGLQRPPRTTVKLPFSPLLDGNKVKQLLRKLILELNIDPRLSTLLVDSVRFVATKPRSVGDIMTNHIRAAKAFQPSRPPPCKCHTIRTLLAHPDAGATQNGHLIAKMEELRLDDNILQANLTWSTHSPPEQTLRRLSEALDAILPPITRLQPTVTPRAYLHPTTGGMTNVYAEDDRRVGAIDNTTLTHLHRRFVAATKTHGVQDAHLPTEVANLLRRYSADRSLTNKTNWSAPTELYDILLRHMRHKIEGFASPLNVHQMATSYFSPYTEDFIFGAMTDGFAHPAHWLLPSVRNPPFTQNMLADTVAWAVSAAMTTTDTHHWLVLPAWRREGDSNHLTLLDHDLTHTVARLPANTICFGAPHTVGNRRTLEPARWETLIVLVASLQTISSPPVSATLTALASYTTSSQGHFAWPRAKSGQPLNEYPVEWTDFWNGHLTPAQPLYAHDTNATGRPIISLNWDDPANRLALKRCLRPSSPSPLFAEAIFTEASDTLDGLIVSPLDHNVGAAVVCCPALHHETLLKTFCQDGDHYQQEDIFPRQAIARWKAFYDKHDIRRLQHWPTNGSLPTPYVLPKNKDILRIRPITPYTHHPLQKSFNIVSRALSHIMERVGLASFTLRSQQDFTAMIEKANRWLARHPHLRAYPRCGDVKNMYTELPHDELLRAIEWVCTKFTETHHTAYVTVQRAKRGMVLNGRRRRSGWVQLALSDISTILRFDIANAMLLVGGRIYSQRKGIPMGSPCSPPLSNLICMLYECPFVRDELQPMTRDFDPAPEAIAFIGRFFDDTTAFFLLSLPHDEALRATAGMWRRVQDIYHRNMVMEDTDCGSGTFKVLSFDVHISEDGGLIRLQAHNPNLDTILRGGNDVRRRFPHMLAPMNPAHKRSTVITMLLAAKRLANSEEGFTTTALAQLLEFANLGYPRNLLRDAVNATALRYRTGGKRSWKRLLAALRPPP